MAQMRRPILDILRNFIDSLRPRSHWGLFVGRDSAGAAYYEIPRDKSGHNRRQSRWFVPPVEEGNTYKVPIEWEAWLRYKRQDPPTDEEIKANLARMNAVIENARKIDEFYKKPGAQQAGASDNENIAFPLREGFEINPGDRKMK